MKPVSGSAPFSGGGRTLGSVVKANSTKHEDDDEEDESSAGAALKSPPKKARTAAEVSFERMVGGNPDSDKD